MHTKLSSIKTTRDKYFDIIYKEVKKLKRGYGISLDEMAKKLGISKKQMRDYGFTKQFNTEMHSGTKYFTK